MVTCPGSHSTGGDLVRCTQVTASLTDLGSGHSDPAIAHLLLISLVLIWQEAATQ